MLSQKTKPIFENACLLFFLLLKIVLSYALVNSVYELQRDEFLHIDQGNHLAAGFTSIPPLTSVFSVIIKVLGNSVFVVKLFPALFGALTIFFAWQIVDELKGGILAKTILAVACICSSFLRLNTLYQPNSFDVLAWTAVFYFLLLYFDKKEVKFLYGMAVSVALGFLNKYNIAFLVIGLTPALLIFSQRKIFINKHFYFAILLGLLIISPNIAWQINHNFPVLKHMKELQETQLVNVNRTGFIIGQLLFFISSICVLLAGIGSLFFCKDFKKYRWVIFTYSFTIALFVYLKAKDYYALGLYPVLLAFGAVYLAKVLAKRYVLTVLLFAFNIGFFIYILPLVMPIYSPEQIVKRHKWFKRVGLLHWEDGKNHQLPQDYADMQGWKEMATLTDKAYEMVKDKSALLIRADNYGQAGAINYYSKFRDINAVAYNADYLYWFKLEKPIKDIIFIRDTYDKDPTREKEKPFFDKITKIGEVKNKFSREYGASVYLLEGAKVDINKIIQSEVKEEQNDH